MKQSYILSLDIAKQKSSCALCDPADRVLCEATVATTSDGLQALTNAIEKLVPPSASLLVIIEATGVLHLNWAAALARAGHQVILINPLAARRLYTVENSIRDNKTDTIDARGLCRIARMHGAQLLERYRFQPDPQQLCLQRLQTVRKQLRSSLTNLKKTYQSLVESSFPELGTLMDLDSVGVRDLLLQAPTPAAIARMRLSTLQKNWMLRPKAAALKALAAASMADPELAQAGALALQSILRSVHAMEVQLKEIDAQIQKATAATIDPQRIALVESLPGLGPIGAGKVLAYLPNALLENGSNRIAATRLQAFMGNDPRLKESGQWKGQARMSKRGVECLRTAFFQAAFNASIHDPQLRAYYLRKREEGKNHHVALTHVMRLLTRRLVAVLRSGKTYDPHYNLSLQNAA